MHGAFVSTKEIEAPLCRKILIGLDFRAGVAADQTNELREVGRPERFGESKDAS
jgi:FAD synthase